MIKYDMMKNRKCFGISSLNPLDVQGCRAAEKAGWIVGLDLPSWETSPYPLPFGFAREATRGSTIRLQDDGRGWPKKG